MGVSLVHRARPSGIPTPGTGSVALVTGASSGVGRELARLLCERGHDIVVVARRRERFEELADELRERFVGRRVEVVPCDLSDPLARESLVNHANALGLNVDTLALAAGFAGDTVDRDSRNSTLPRSHQHRVRRRSRDGPYGASHAILFGEPKDVARAGIHAPRLLWLPFGRRLMA
jgi:hypothetical protein